MQNHDPSKYIVLPQKKKKIKTIRTSSKKLEEHQVKKLEEHQIKSSFFSLHCVIRYYD